MESIKRDILGCATIAVVKPSQGCLFTAQWPRAWGAGREDTHPSIWGETASFVGWMLLPPRPRVLISGKCSETRREVRGASPGPRGTRSIGQAGGCGRSSWVTGDPPPRVRQVEEN